MFTVNINTANAAFEGEEARDAELARILRDLADRLERTAGDPTDAVMRLRDVNGNRVGFAAFTEEGGNPDD